MATVRRGAEAASSELEAGVNGGGNPEGAMQGDDALAVSKPGVLQEINLLPSSSEDKGDKEELESMDSGSAPSDMTGSGTTAVEMRLDETELVVDVSEVATGGDRVVGDAADQKPAQDEQEEEEEDDEKDELDVKVSIKDGGMALLFALVPECEWRGGGAGIDGRCELWGERGCADFALTCD